jgi:hypothetical protein
MNRRIRKSGGRFNRFPRWKWLFEEHCRRADALCHRLVWNEATPNDHAAAAAAAVRIAARQGGAA